MKKTICYLKMSCSCPEADQLPGTAALLNALDNPDSENAVEMWKPTGLQSIPPPGCEIETGEISGYSRVEAVFIRERTKAILVCITLEDNFRNSLKTLEKEGWKVWKKGDTEALAKTPLPKAR